MIKCCLSNCHSMRIKDYTAILKTHFNAHALSLASKERDGLANQKCSFDAPLRLRRAHMSRLESIKMELHQMLNNSMVVGLKTWV